MRARAIANWKRLRIVMVLLKVCGGNVLTESVNTKHYEEQNKAPLTLGEAIAPYIINPMNRYKVLWDLSLGHVYLLSFLMDPYTLAFHFEPL